MCTISKKKVSWTIDSDFISDIKKHLKEGDNEQAGVLLFRDINCSDGICQKTSTKYRISKGNGSSVYTPNGLINFHTHPKFAYKHEDAVYGWPSGEDMAVCINFAKDGTLIHIVFTLEGAYIIKVNKILNVKDTKMLENLFKTTHVFRSSDQKNQLRDFKDTFELPGNNTVKMWLNLANSISLNKLYKLHNLINNKRLKVPKDDENIFEVSLVPINKTLNFKANYIPEKCHLMNFNKFA